MSEVEVVPGPDTRQPVQAFRGRRVVRRLARNPLAVAGFVVLALALLGAVFAELIAPYAADATHFDEAMTPPGSAGYLLGTDDLGRDLFSRILFGMRSSLEASVLAVAVALAAGVPLGLAAGYSPLLDTVISRFTDLVLAFPFLILAVGLAAIRGPSLGNAAIAIGVAQIPGMVRVVRSETLRLKALDFVAAAIVSSASDAWVLARHILPNAMSAIIVQATVAIPVAILGEAVLSFLGLGIRPPQPSLGTMLSDAQQYAARAPWTAIIPGVAIMLVALAFNLFGDGLRDALDPRSSRR
jgi:peptide/nickel transport system permease protein